MDGKYFHHDKESDSLSLPQNEGYFTSTHPYQLLEYQADMQRCRFNVNLGQCSLEKKYRQVPRCSGAECCLVLKVSSGVSLNCSMVTKWCQPSDCARMTKSRSRIVDEETFFHPSIECQSFQVGELLRFWMVVNYQISLEEFHYILLDLSTKMNLWKLQKWMK